MQKANASSGGDERGVTAYVVLGLLLDEPGTGYELAARAESSIAHFWPITRSGIYTELPRLEQRGFAVSERIEQSNYPDKRTYTPTAAGAAEFTRWLTQAQLEERPRHPSQLLLYFAAHGSSGQAETLLDRWQAQADRTALTCTRILAAKGVDPTDFAHGTTPDPRALTALFGLRRAESDSRFLQEARAALDLAGRATPTQPAL